MSGKNYLNLRTNGHDTDVNWFRFQSQPTDFSIILILLLHAPIVFEPPSCPHVKVVKRRTAACVSTLSFHFCRPTTRPRGLYARVRLRGYCATASWWARRKAKTNSGEHRTVRDFWYYANKLKFFETRCEINYYIDELALFINRGYLRISLLKRTASVQRKSRCTHSFVGCCFIIVP